MPDPDVTNDAPPPSGPCLSTWGPLDGPILGRDESPALGVVTADSPVMPVGIAYPTGHVGGWQGEDFLGKPEATWRLMIGKVEVEGRFLLRGGAFVELAEGAE